MESEALFSRAFIARTGALAIALAAMTLGATATAQSDETPKAPDKNAAAIRDAVRFSELARKGDSARAASKYSEAVIAYTEALAIRDDPTIAGRLGLILLDAEMPTKAADFLLDAVERGNSTPGNQAERLRFFLAYDKARAEVCWLEISVSPVGASVFIDDEEKLSSADAESYIFIRPGLRKIRAHLAGHEDVTVEVMAEKGGNAKVALKLNSSDAPPLLKPESKPIAILQPSDDKSAIGPAPIPKEAPAVALPSRNPSEWRLLAGPTVLFNIAPSTAFGVSAIASYQKPHVGKLGLAIDAGILATWTEANLAGAPLRTSFYAAQGAACVRYSVILGCPLLLLGNRRRSSTDESRILRGTESDVIFGGGLRLGLEKMFSGSFGARLHGDAVILSEKLSVDITNSRSLWVGANFLASVTLAMVGQF